MRCLAIEPYVRIHIQCVLDGGHDGDHLDAFGDYFMTAAENDD